jgi:hypothetical protein
MADYDPLMYAPHAPGAPPPPQQNVPQQNNPPPQQQEPLFIGPQNLVGPRLPPIDDIVANDPEIRRICSELARFLETKANNSYVIDYAHATSRALIKSPLSINEYRSKPTDTLFYPTTFIEPVKFFVRNATKPNRLPIDNPQTSIATLENSLNNTLSDANLGSASSSDVSSRGPYFMPNVDPNQNMKRVYRSVQITGGIPHLDPLYHSVLLKPGEGMIDKNTARQYVNLILQLYRRIQAILVENGFQQGGKKRRRQTKTKRKRRQTKKRRRTYKK